MYYSDYNYHFYKNCLKSITFYLGNLEKSRAKLQNKSNETENKKFIQQKTHQLKL